MYELRVSVKKVMGSCTADPPLEPGNYFTVSNGDISVPKGGYICLWALQSMMPLLTAKERELAEDKDEDWMWRVHHVQCPDPNGRVIFRIDRIGRVGREPLTERESPGSDGTGRQVSAAPRGGALKDLRVEVESVNGHCTSRMGPGDHFTLRGGRLQIPAGKSICLYALQAALPLLPAKQRVLQDGDWLKDDCRVLCPDPAGNVILRIDRVEQSRNDPL